MSDLKQRLLHFSCELGSHDGELHFAQAQSCYSGRFETFNVLADGHLACIEDVNVGSLGKVLKKFSLRRPDEHVVHEQGMIRPSAEGPYFQSRVLIPADVPVHNDAAHLMVDVVSGELLDDSEGLKLDRDVFGAFPVHRFFSLGILNHAFLSLVSHLLQSRICAQCTTIADIGLLGRKVRWCFQQERNFVELGDSGVDQQVAICDAHSLYILDVLLVGKQT